MTMKMRDLSEMFAVGSGFLPVSDKLRKECCYPNSLYFNHPGGVIVLVVWRSSNGSDFPLNAKGLRYVLDGERTKKMQKAYVVFADGKQGDASEVVAEFTAIQLQAQINGYSPLEGDYGPYWWLNEDGRIANAGRWQQHRELPY